MAKKILIIDDDNGFVSKLIGIDLDCKFNFAFADSLKRAKLLVTNYNFDLILANVKVPDGNSYEFKKEVMFNKPQTHFLFMSGIEADYNDICRKGEKCLHKFELNDLIEGILADA
jgi:two-component SAPR family response regulator